MSRAARTRLSLGLAGGLVALAAWLAIDRPALAILVAVLIFFASSAAAELVFRRTASEDEIRADLEDRVRHPPN